LQASPRAYTGEHLEGVHLGRPLPYSKMTRQKVLAGTNALAYLTLFTVVKKKGFITLTHGIDVIKKFSNFLQH
jgi:hypothetical protein